MARKIPVANPRARFNDLSNPIQKLRAYAGLTQHELREALGVSQAVVAMWETGARRPGRRIVPAVLNLARKHGLRLTEADLIRWKPKE